MKSCSEDFWEAVGCAAIIFATLLGFGVVVVLLGVAVHFANH